MKKLLSSILLSVFSLLPTMILAEPADFTVAGAISFTKTGDIYIELVTPPTDETSEQEHNDLPPGLQIHIGDAEKEAGKVAFTFEHVPAGTYGIQAFQDVNGNGELDSGKFGPKEPWGFYRNARPHFRGPEFKEIAFEVTEDMHDIIVTVK